METREWEKSEFLHPIIFDWAKAMNQNELIVTFFYQRSLVCWEWEKINLWDEWEKILAWAWKKERRNIQLKIIGFCGKKHPGDIGR